MNFPHQYAVTASVAGQQLVQLSADNLPTLASAPPTEFNGPGDQWSPEDLLVAAVADCFVLSFRAVAAMSKLDWVELRCDATGTLDKVERDIQFTAFQLKATLTLPAGGDASRAQRVLEKAKAACFITNSVKADADLETEILHAE